MPKITVTQKGDFKILDKYLKKLKDARFYEHIERYAQLGVEALREATPIDSGLTSESWGYEIETTDNKTTISWTNSNDSDGWFNVALYLQYGHGTGTGGYVYGIDYINPAMKSVFEKIANDLWMEVTALE